MGERPNDRLHYLRWAELSGLLAAMAAAPLSDKGMVMDDAEIKEAADALMTAVRREMTNG